MLYQALKTTPIRLDGHSVLQWECGKGVVIMPQNECKLYAHWHNPNGKLRSTYTITVPTQIEGLVQLTNALDTEALFQIVHLA
jgi:uncharacterized protein (DUF3820 family)